VRWDSDHVAILSDETLLLAQEVVRSGALDRVYFGTDYFDASINRVAAWVVGARNMIKALLIALLEPTNKLKDAERKMDFTERLALFEEQKSLPWAAVWDAYCVRQGVPVGMAWFDEVRQYEKAVLSTRLP
jgi:L-rhamnose isomerase